MTSLARSSTQMVPKPRSAVKQALDAAMAVYSGPIEEQPAT
jgi:hypothetical protein